MRSWLKWSLRHLDGMKASHDQKCSCMVDGLPYTDGDRRRACASYREVLSELATQMAAHDVTRAERDRLAEELASRGAFSATSEVTD